MTHIIPYRNRHTLADTLSELRGDLDRYFSDWMSHEPGHDAFGATYPVDIHEEDDTFVVDAELPGFKRGDIDISVENGVLEITADREPEENKGRRHLNERRFTHISRRLPLPSDVDDENARAQFRDGVLHIELPKREESRSRRIEIKA